MDQYPKEIPRCKTTPPWSAEKPPLIECSIPGIGPKDSQSGIERKSLTLEHLNQHYPKETWTYVYTDGSAEEAVRNGGAGIYVQYPAGIEDRLSFPTGRYSTNFRAEAEALKLAAEHIKTSPLSTTNVVFLSDALSVLQSLKSGKNLELNDVTTSLTSLTKTHAVTLQWIPSHCDLHGIDAADKLAKEGSAKGQEDNVTSYTEVKTIIKANQAKLWNQEHPRYNSRDEYHLLDRREQVCVFRLRTGHNRLNHHLYNKFRIGTTDQCPCERSQQTTEHVLQSCPLFQDLRAKFWPTPVPLLQKLYGNLADLRSTAAFIRDTGLSI